MALDWHWDGTGTLVIDCQGKRQKIDRLCLPARRSACDQSPKKPALSG